LPDRPTTPDELLPRFDLLAGGRDHQADALVAPVEEAVEQVVVFLGALAALAFQPRRRCQALLHLERTPGAQVDGAGDARQGVGRVGRLVDQHLVHQLRRHVQQVRLGRAHVAGAEILLAVQQGDDLGQAADVDVLPSPASRWIWTPGMRCSESAMVTSGSLPMSSDEMASTIEASRRLTSTDASASRGCR
jgi:hypothetical protein